MRLFHLKRRLFSFPAILSLSALLFSCGGGGSGGPGDTAVPPPAGPLVVSPAAVTLHAGDNQQFSATLQGAADSKVTWSLAEEAAGGSIDVETGAYKAPTKAGTYHVIATSTSKSTLTASAVVTVTPPAGSPDLSFGKNGKLTTIPGFGSYDTAESVAIQADGKIVIAGETFNGTSNDFLLARFNVDGTLDSTFGNGGKVLIDFSTADVRSDDGANAILIYPNGKILVAGAAFNGNNFDFALARYDTQGRPDTSFGTGGKVMTPVGSKEDIGAVLAFGPDSTIFVAGTFDSSTTNLRNHDFAIVKYDDSGNLVTGFGAGGKVKTPVGPGDDNIFAIALAGSDIIVAGDTFNGSDYDFIMARYDSTGALVSTFGTSGIKTVAIRPNHQDVIRAMEIQNNKVLVAGFSSDAAGSVMVLARFNLADGQIDSTFGTGGIVTTPVAASPSFALALGIDSSDRIVIAGEAFNGNIRDFVVARYNADGHLDAAFNTGGIVTTDFGGDDFVHALAIQADDKIVAVGASSDENNQDIAMARYDVTGALDPSFKTTGKETFNPENASGVAQTLAIQRDGKIVVGGDSFAGNDIRFTLMRYGSDGKMDPSFGKEGKRMEFFSAGYGGKVILRPDDSIVVAGTYFDPINATTDFVIRRYDTDGTFQGGDTVGFSGNGFQNQDFLSALALQPDGKILVAGSTLSMDINKTGSDFDFALARLNDDGSLDTSFGTNGTVVTSFVDGDAVHTDDDVANAMALQSDGKIILAGYAVDGPVAKFALARYNPNGSLDPSFGTNGKVSTGIGAGNAAANAIRIQSDGKIIVGGYTVENKNYNFAIVRYKPDGTLDGTFGGGGGVVTAIDIGNDAIFDLAIQPDGKIVAAGFSNVVNSDFAIARYNSDGAFDRTFGQSGVRIFPVGQNIDYVNAVAIQPDGKIVVAGGASTGTRNEFALARFWP